MENYVTWNDLIQIGTFIVSVASFIYAIFRDNKKR